MDEFVPISNGDAWDLFLENLILKNEIQALKEEIENIKNPIYCVECGSCGEVAGCCDVHRCLYLNAHQGEYDDLVKENIELTAELALNKVLNEGRTLVVIDRSLQSFPDE